MTMMEAAEARLAEVLNAPTGPSHHAQVEALAAERAATGPPTGVYVKEAAVAEAASGTTALTGQFEALVSTWDVDRQGERFTPPAFEPALAKIRQAGKAVPVLFGHDASAISAVLGLVPADGWRTDARGLHARGWIDVHALERAGRVATCNPGGAGKWRDEYATLLANADVIVIADRDDAGRKHAAQVAESLEGVAAHVWTFEPAVGKDV